MRLRYSRDELLAEHPYAARISLLGRRIHGGLTADGAYRSPRTLFRAPAIAAWTAALEANGQPTAIIDCSHVPPFFPNVAQTRVLLRHGVVEPISRMLSMTAMVEGAGRDALARLPRPPLTDLVKEPISDTAVGHLHSGLIEAHGLDEAGSDLEGGHKAMWELARDLALHNPPVPADVVPKTIDPNKANLPRLHPDLPEELEILLTALMHLLAMEVFADSTMEWAKEVLADPELCWKPIEASNVISYIQTDEAIHVAYLTAVMSELRMRTFVTDGGEVPAGPIIDAMVARTSAVHSSDRTQFIRATRRGHIERALSGRPDGARILDEFDRYDDRTVAR